MAALTIGASAGCTTHDVHDENCPDEDQDGICDEIEEDDGDGFSTKKKKSYSGISSGSKGGIGSSGAVSGG